MKRIVIALMAIGLLFTSCQKNELPVLDQNPYRIIVDYTPGTCDMTVAGTLTPDENYDWITVSQSGDKATFTFRRNTTGLVRTAVYSMGGSKAKVFQKAHGLDASLETSLVNQGLGQATIQMTFATSYLDDYVGWGIVYSKTSEPGAGTSVQIQGKPVIGKNVGTVTGLDEGCDYYFWPYVLSTEGDKVLGPMLAVIPPVYVQAGEDLQAALDGAKEFSEVRVAGGATFSNTIKFSNSCKNKAISGGWNADFTSQSMENLTVLDLADAGFGFWCAGDDSFGPLDGYAEISYFEIKNCKGDHGTAVHACGGPVTVHHCYVHDNHGEKGAIGTREEDFTTTINIYNCTISDNKFENGHGAALHFGDGVDHDNQVMATVVNNLIINNEATKYDGYCAVYMCYNNTDLVFVNNTVVGNFNYREYGGEYPGMNHRGDVRSLHANNIIVGNRTSENVTPAVKVPYDYFFSFDGAAGTFTYNVYEGQLKDAGNASVSDNYMKAAGFDIKTVLADPDNLDYSPRGEAVNGGTLGVVSYKENRDASAKSVDIAKLLEKYNTDLSGEPRVVDGKVCCGCFQK